MQSNNKKSKQIITNKSGEEPVDVLLLKNQELLDRLLQENLNKKERSFLTSEEYELMFKYEKNIIDLIQRCPLAKFKEIFGCVRRFEEDNTNETSKEDEGCKGKKEED